MTFQTQMLRYGISNCYRQFKNGYRSFTQLNFGLALQMGSLAFTAGLFRGAVLAI